ncbi:hypothetical protein M378DRAFT_399760 [Amanita muscaria Koide BX008]|uniref:Uncharacterized protein n=1 Tax=Amanita muscaria (strain Koide BX008) TaxID=946122 RepID=A0A0C2WKL3_AMAMK|nr:hypothetical protein M378DRAFT_399760 [Amanita muscaria Koide BX008]
MLPGVPDSWRPLQFYRDGQFSDMNKTPCSHLDLRDPIYAPTHPLRYRDFFGGAAAVNSSKKPIGFFTENMLRSSQGIEINAIDTPCQDAWQTSGNLDDDVWDTSPLPDFNSTSNRYCPASTFIYAHVPPEAVKLLLPEVYHPHTQKMCTTYGIPFPICIRNIVVPFPSEVDAWNIYYFAEDPDATPYSAGLTW